MRAWFRLTLSVLGLAAVLGGMVLSWPGLGRGAAPWAGERGGRPGTRLVAPPSAQSEVLCRRIAGKQSVVERLLEGELGLMEAAAAFRFLSDNPPEYPCQFRPSTPGRSDGEKACRHLLRWLESYLVSRMPRSQAAEIVCRYQAELDALLAETEEVALPW